MRACPPGPAFPHPPEDPDHDRTHHPSHGRRTVPDRRGRRRRGRRRPAADRLRRPDRRRRTKVGGDSARAARRPLFDKLPKKVQDDGRHQGRHGHRVRADGVQGRAGKIVGIDPDLADALGKQLGVKLRVHQRHLRRPDHRAAAPAATTSPCPSMTRHQGPPGGPGRQGQEGRQGRRLRRLLHRRRLDLRQEGQPREASSPSTDLCGKKVAVQRGTISTRPVKTQIDKCKKDGKGQITIEAVRQRRRGPDPAEGRRRRRRLSTTSRSPRTSREDRRRQGLRGRRRADRRRPVRHRRRQGQRPSCATRSRRPSNAIIENGEYEKVLEKWGVEDGAVTEATINGGS